MKDKIIVGVLALFFVCFGIHLFCLDEAAKDITYLTATIVGSILSLIIIGFLRYHIL
jgi:TM2 domain-containing membrane protein YozV